MYHAVQTHVTLAPPPNAWSLPKNAQLSTKDPPKMPCLTSQLTKHGLGPWRQTTPRAQHLLCQTHFPCALAPIFEVPGKTKEMLGHRRARRPTGPAGTIAFLIPHRSEVSQGVARDKLTAVGPPKSNSQPFPDTGAPRTYQMHQLTVVTHPRQPILNAFTHP